MVLKALKSVRVVIALRRGHHSDRILRSVLQGRFGLSMG